MIEIEVKRGSYQPRLWKFTIARAIGREERETMIQDASSPESPELNRNNAEHVADSFQFPTRFILRFQFDHVFFSFFLPRLLVDDSKSR